ncbi:MAG: ABC transporter permease [Treponema sp.]|jgi:putative spermidine/putrescine transport system permease protein|nr:ABC transporter permease [Treponema sp.]
MKGRFKTLAFLLGAGVLFLVFFFLVPLAAVIRESFFAEGKFTFSRYLAVLTGEQFRGVYLRTIRIALIVTPAAVLAGYPTAYLMTRLRPGSKGFLMSLVILPLMTSSVARTYAWIVILGRFGIVNQTLSFLKLIQEPLRLLYTEGAIVVGLLQLFLPVMVLNLVSALENVPGELEEAALSLGSNRAGTFFRVIMPLSFDGLVMGSTLVFTGCITAYVTPAVLGGANVLTLSTLMRQQALVLMDWEAATVIALVMIASTLVLHSALRMFRPGNQT